MSTIQHTAIFNQRRNCCKFRCKGRLFYSKGAVLVLIWTLLVNFSIWSLFTTVSYRYVNISVYFNSVPFISFVGSAFLSGWLADARFGNYRVIRAGFLFLFLASLVTCVYVLIHENDLLTNSRVFNILSFFVVNCLSAAGYGIFMVTSLELGLDQMPDASTTNITSFIAWFVFNFYAGYWIGEAVLNTRRYCLNIFSESTFIQIWCLFLFLCMCIVLCFDFLLSQKWLTIEPKAPKSLKTIFKVLKFAAKNKAPIQRSALTYWEENIPSRIDLGKSRYGGPFTTEQVEDVKTVLRLLVISVAFWVVTCSLKLPTTETTITNITDCAASTLYSFTYNYRWYVIIGTLIYECAVYPLLRNRLPSSLKRIGFASFLITAANLVYLALGITSYFYENIIIDTIANIMHSVIIGLSAQLLLTSKIEFVCAQSPYNMRGLFAAYVFFITGTSYLVLSTFSQSFSEFCTHLYCSIVYRSVMTILSVIGFILQCILAHSYKRRVRDDNYYPQRVVEDVYNRYLSVPDN